MIFDLDDTLVDQETASRAAVISWAAELGLGEAMIPGPRGGATAVPGRTARPGAGGAPISGWDAGPGADGAAVSVRVEGLGASGAEVPGSDTELGDGREVRLPALRGAEVAETDAEPGRDGAVNLGHGGGAADAEPGRDGAVVLGRGGGAAEIAERWARVSERHYARYQRREISFAEQRRERVREFLGRALSEREADDLFAGYLEQYEAGWVVFDDAVPALRRARAAGLTVAVLTNGEESQQVRKVDRVGLAEEIDMLVASSTLPAGKPDPRAFRHTVERLKVDVGRALMIGDSFEKDVAGAQAAGLPAILLDREDAHVGIEVPRIRSLHELTFAS
ncbi:HAD family hydrolase [Actinoplanes sp. NPDC049596]|uniref:HAD family hydrolase n=1 Tax=unclassified Actinoplanes TaxID=2626549 RepID=UPI00341D2802